MADKHYVGEIGTIVLVDCGCDITGATLTKLKVKRPDDKVVEWTAVIDGTNFLKYVLVADDLPLSGLYFLQASLVLAGWQGLGETVDFHVYDYYK